MLLRRDRRGHLALLSSIILVTVFGYVMLQPRTVRVQADGREITVETRASNDAALLQRTGIDLRDGDRVTALDAPDAEVLRVERAQSVRLRVDGETYELRTHAATIGQLLDEAGVAIQGRDAVLLDGSLVSPAATLEAQPLLATLSASPSSLAGDIELEVRRAVEFSVTDDGRELPATSSSRPTVALALREAGVQIGPGDEIVPDPASPLEAGAHIAVRRARTVTVTLPTSHRTLHTHATTVGDALAEGGVDIPSDSFTEPSRDTPITDGMYVRVVQLSSSSDIEREFIESKTLYKYDADLGPGETRTEQGHDGVLVRRYEIAYVNGEEAGRELAEEYYDPEPVDTVIYYPEQQGAGDDAPREGNVARTINVYATWYNPASSGRSPDDPAYGRTATGVQVTYGVVAVDPRVIPLGTRMFIPGYGYAVAADTGGAVQGYIIDLGYPDGVEVNWRSHWLDIYILE